MLEDNKKVVFLGGDHAGFKSKVELLAYLKAEGYDAVDLGVFNEDPADYPDIAREVGEKVQEHPEAKGILICGSGIGMSIAANKLRGIRAVVANDENMAELSRQHNDANILTMGGRIISVDEMKKIVVKFLTTEFEKNEERRVRRVDKLNNM
ncbi:MAG: ribose 5-phosphate isomerase B [Patescibacteria group bacterium]